MIDEIGRSGNAPIITPPMTEEEAIPFQPASLRGERLLVLAPHPDDEVIGCGGVVAAHLLEGRSVRVVVATDGTAADDLHGGDREAYRSLREEESERGLALLGGDRQPPGAPVMQLEFLRFVDRRLGDSMEELIERLRVQLESFPSDLILAPSPVEIHPDHRALAVALCQLVQRDDALFARLATARVAFYEVGQPLRPNTLVDITEVAETKYAAIAAHQSQNDLRDYTAFARGLNAYRAMTLPAASRYAEAYYVLDLVRLRTTPISALVAEIGNARGPIVVADAALPISVIVRTKNRPALLKEALASVRSGGYPAEIVVVNDGGATPAVEGVTLIEHETSRGRSEAMNAGVRAAASPYIAFLDDDDLFYPEHLPVLARAAEGSPRTAWYSDAVSAFLRVGPSGGLETEKRLRLFGDDFDSERLLIDNYIPLPTLLVRRDDYLAVGGFDPEFDLFEDWDFLIRLSRRGPFVHIPRITCEIRHIAGGDSIVLSAPEGSPRFREAKHQIWRKHAALVDHDVLANVFERQKQRGLQLSNEITEARGLRHHLETAVARVEREKGELMVRMSALHEEATGHALRVRDLEGLVRQMEIGAEVAAKIAARESAVLADERDRLRHKEGESQTTINALYLEIHRLQGVLETIYGSRTWKLHTMVEKMKGRG
jgi:LmbE family N-acetylglucosaminyl deacetylase/glycosyltransferase involved in cell wall biosynthesis